MCGETPTDLRMPVRPSMTNFWGLSVILTDMQRKTAIRSPNKSGREARNVEDWVHTQPQLFSMSGINHD
jgi:hypothetical protein